MNKIVPRIAILPGDPAGVGPEMAVRLLHREANRAMAELVLIADPVVLQTGERVVGVCDGRDRHRQQDDVKPAPAKSQGDRPEDQRDQRHADDWRKVGVGEEAEAERSGKAAAESANGGAGAGKVDV